MEFFSSIRKFIISHRFFSVLLLVSSICCLLVGGHQDDNGFGFSYDENSPAGPSHWGEIKQEWKLCGTGKMQSPIDLQLYRALGALRLGKLDTRYHSSQAILVNHYTGIALEWEDGGGINIDGITYSLKECHWHSPSEHLMDGRRFDLEIHLVLKSLSGNVTVVGMVYEIGLPDPFLCKIESYIKELKEDGIIKGDKEIDVGNVDPEGINLGIQGYYRYMGSLTTPPCSENVVWTVMTKVASVSREQIELIRNEALIHEPKTNARPVQQSNHRLIELYL